MTGPRPGRLSTGPVPVRDKRRWAYDLAWLGVVVVLAAASLLALAMRLTINPCSFVERSDPEFEAFNCGAARGDP